MTFLVGWVWGLLLCSAVIIVNQNYEAFKAFTDAGNAEISLAIIAFIFGSLFIIAVILLSGVLQMLAGRKMPGRWKTLFGVAIGVTSASVTLRFFPVVL